VGERSGRGSARSAGRASTPSRKRWRRKCRRRDYRAGKSEAVRRRWRGCPPRKKCTHDRAGMAPAGSCVARARRGKGHRVSPGIGRPPRDGRSKSIKRRDSPSQTCSAANAFIHSRRQPECLAKRGPRPLGKRSPKGRRPHDKSGLNLNCHPFYSAGHRFVNSISDTKCYTI